MILLDPRTGSGDLLPLLQALTYDVCLAQIEFGDAAWSGNGPDGTALSIGVEIKKVNDLLDSLMGGRFAGHQLPGLLERYDRVWLLIEGSFRPDALTGILQTPSGGGWRDARRNMMWRDLMHWLMTIEVQTGIRIARTFNRHETARWLAAAHSWWVNKDWADHKSLHQFNVSQPQVAQLVRAGFVRRVAKEAKGVGWERSGAVAARFKSVREMANAGPQVWREIEGIGEVMSKRIFEEFGGKH